MRKIYNKLNDNNKKIENFNELLDANVIITFDGNFVIEAKGGLIAFDNTWIEIESINKKIKRGYIFIK